MEEKQHHVQIVRQEHMLLKEVEFVEIVHQELIQVIKQEAVQIVKQEHGQETKQVHAKNALVVQFVILKLENVLNVKKDINWKMENVNNAQLERIRLVEIQRVV